VSLTVQVAQRGVLTLPKALRDAYNIKTGDTFTVVDLGSGALLFTPMHSKLDDLLEGMRIDLEESGESLASMLRSLRAKREQLLVEPTA
jgi:bifunctional DNA-binding transcriptional regulator/antitoxin component of YhaV-PrlF toxin-antitoxin module